MRFEESGSDSLQIGKDVDLTGFLREHGFTTLILAECRQDNEEREYVGGRSRDGACLAIKSDGEWRVGRLDTEDLLAVMAECMVSTLPHQIEEAAFQCSPAQLSDLVKLADSDPRSAREKLAAYGAHPGSHGQLIATLRNPVRTGILVPVAVEEAGDRFRRSARPITWYGGTDGHLIVVEFPTSRSDDERLTVVLADRDYLAIASAIALSAVSEDDWPTLRLAARG